MTRLDDRLLPVLLRQHWLVTRDDVAEVGGTEDQIAGRVRDGRWIRVDRGVYWPSEAPTSWEATALAPILSVPSGVRAMASDLTAAALHGIPGFGRGRPELSVERPYNLRRPGIRIRTSSDLDRCQAVTMDGIPTTDLRRTLLDLGRSVTDQRLLRAIEWAPSRTGRDLVGPRDHARPPRSARPGWHSAPPPGDPRQRPSRGDHGLGHRAPPHRPGSRGGPARATSAPRDQGGRTGGGGDRPRLSRSPHRH